MRAAYYFDHRWIAQAQLNHIQVFGGPDTTALPFGIGYQLEAKGRPGPWERAVPRTSKVTNNEVTIMLGKTTLNSGNSESANAGSLEYRRGLWRYVDVTASYIHEDGQIQSRRDGVAVQLWATRAFFDDASRCQSALGRIFHHTKR
jgi:hypothetical protein